MQTRGFLSVARRLVEFRTVGESNFTVYVDYLDGTALGNGHPRKFFCGYLAQSTAQVSRNARVRFSWRTGNRELTLTAIYFKAISAAERKLSVVHPREPAANAVRLIPE